MYMCVYIAGIPNLLVVDVPLDDNVEINLKMKEQISHIRTKIMCVFRYQGSGSGKYELQSIMTQRRKKKQLFFLCIFFAFWNKFKFDIEVFKE